MGGIIQQMLRELREDELISRESHLEVFRVVRVEMG